MPHLNCLKVQSAALHFALALRQNQSMLFETLYRTDARGKSFTNPSDCEYFQPRIDHELREGKDVYYARETHGYFDDKQKKLVNQTETFNPDEPFTTWQEADRWYQQQLRYRAASGFVHAFAWDPMSPTGTSYRILPRT
jgi:hypothetical protein